MRSKIAAITLLASTTISGYSLNAQAQNCYDASGFVSTENVTPTLQIGDINLELSDESGLVFSNSGSLVGNITGSDANVLAYLSHTARFPQGDSFVTNGDEAVLNISPENNYNPVRNFYVDYSGEQPEVVACSFWIKETITKIPKGTRMFKNVTDVEIIAEGYISNCPGENENYFELSGELCVD